MKTYAQKSKFKSFFCLFKKCVTLCFKGDKMTLKDFLRAWKECEKYDEQNKFNDELREKYGVDIFEFDEIESELRDLKLQEFLLSMFYDYFLDELYNGNVNASILEEWFEFGGVSVKEVMERDNVGEIMVELEKFFEENIRT